jgi:hypothetical protein
MRKKIFIVLLFLLLFAMFGCTEKQEEDKHENEYVRVDRLEYIDNEKIPVVDLEHIYEFLDPIVMVKNENSYYFYFEVETYPFYRLVNNEKIYPYYVNEISYIKVSDITNIKVGD